MVIKTKEQKEIEDNILSFPFVINSDEALRVFSETKLYLFVVLSSVTGFSLAKTLSLIFFLAERI